MLLRQALRMSTDIEAQSESTFNLRVRLPTFPIYLRMQVGGGSAEVSFVD